MEKFMLVMREDLKKMKHSTEKELRAGMEEMTEWTQRLMDSGNYVSSAPLEVTGRYVSKVDVLSDGPFIEAKEGIAGYYIIEAENIDEAVSIALTSPLLKKGEQVIEVRPILV